MGLSAAAFTFHCSANQIQRSHHLHVILAGLCSHVLRTNKQTNLVFQVEENITKTSISD